MSKQIKNTNRYTINSIDKSLDLLEILAKEPLNLLELVERLEQPKSSLFRMITTLENRGYITKDDEDGKYCLGLKVLELTKNLLINNTLTNVSRHEMQKLVDKTGESVNLGVMSGGEILYVAVFEGNHQLKFTDVVGSKAPFHASAIGKVIAAFMNKEDLDKLIKNAEFNKITPKTIVNKEDFYKNLETIKINGYALDNEEVAIGARCIAAPIFDMFGKVEAAVSISSAIHRLPDDELERISNIVINTAKSISQRLGFDVQ